MQNLNSVVSNLDSVLLQKTCNFSAAAADFMKCKKQPGKKSFHQ